MTFERHARKRSQARAGLRMEGGTGVRPAGPHKQQCPGD
jgi:hypothetical protein